MNSLQTLDIAHPPLQSGEAISCLDETLRQVLMSRTVHVVKIIRGHGKSGKGGLLKQVVLDWAYRNRKRIRAVIPGEQYGVFDERTLEMRTACGQTADPDLGRGNPGIAAMWVK